jgi:hypothetical protein
MYSAFVLKFIFMGNLQWLKMGIVMGSLQSNPEMSINILG